jgi:hypothetical protein
MINHEPDRDHQRRGVQARDSERAYHSIWKRLEESRALERQGDARALQRTGIVSPARFYGRKPEEIAPAFDFAMQRIWDLGTIDVTGRADTELRRTYHLIAKGRAPVTEADVIALGQMPDAQLRLLLAWLAHRLSLAEVDRSILDFTGSQGANRVYRSWMTPLSAAHLSITE